MRLSVYISLAVAVQVVVCVAADSVCSSGIYKALAPLSTYAPAQKFCSQKYPAGTTTIYKRDPFRAEGHERRAAGNPATTSTKNAPTTLTTSKSAGTTSKASGNDELMSELSSAAVSVAKTFCSCIQPPKTVKATTTSSTRPSTTTSSAAPATPTCEQEGRTQNRIGPNDYSNPYPGGDNFNTCKAYCLSQNDASSIQTVAHGTVDAPACACYNLPINQVYQPEAGTGAFFSDINCPS